MRWVLFLVALLACAVPARAAQTIQNFYGNATIVNLYDVNGNIIDAHWGNIVQYGADQPIYWHGTSSYCGWAPANLGLPWCGLKTYKCANATGGPDLLNCVDEGLLFDPSTWQTACGPHAGNFAGCWQAPMIYNAANNNYILYMEQQWQTGPPASQLYYFICTTPVGPCTYGGVVTLSHDISSGSPFVDDNGDAYYVYDTQSTFTIYVDKLNSSYTAWDGVNTNSGLGLTNYEAPVIFKHGSNYIIGFGNLCGDCGGGGGLIVTNTCANLLTCTATSNTTNLESANNACFSQILAVAKITAGGQTTWLYQGIRFNQFQNNNNHGESAYYFQPLTFVSDQAQTFTCQASISIPGITPSTYPLNPSTLLHPPHDQSDFPGNNATFTDQFIQNVDNAQQWLQTFVPTSSKLFAVGFGLGFNSICSPSTACASTNPGTATLDVVSITSGCTVGSTLASVNFDNTNTGWASTWKVAPVNLTGLTPGNTYGLRLRAAGVGTNMYWASPQIAKLTAGTSTTPTPYAAGVFCGSTNSGSTWTTFATGSLMFETYLAPISGPLFAH